MQNLNKNSSIIQAAADEIIAAQYLTAFTGAGISVESGVPSFRGENGLWNTYDPSVLDIGYFKRYTEDSWKVIRKIFYDFFAKAKPNPAHIFLSELEKIGKLDLTITQNIDNLHFDAGSKNVAEYHGNSRKLVCMKCGDTKEAEKIDLNILPPKCSCSGVYKPDFVFFGEGIPSKAAQKAEEAARLTDVMILIGTTGEVYPAAILPRMASRLGATIIEINPDYSGYTDEITDLFIPLKAGEAAVLLHKALIEKGLNISQLQ
ncbi:MAG: SIR2 family NAD-dependent protein deacylase [Spirochaetia bacterium]